MSHPDKDESMGDKSADALLRVVTTAASSTSPDPEEATKVPNAKVYPKDPIRKHARENPDMTRNARWPNAEAMSAERMRRLEEYKDPMIEFSKNTRAVRNWAAHKAGMEKLRGVEREKLQKKIARLEAELAKAQADLLQIDEADEKLGAEHGEEIRAGEIAAAIVAQHEKFLQMEDDNEPEF